MAADRDRIRAALIARLGVAAFPNSAPQPMPKAMPQAAVGGTAKLLASMALVGAVSFGGGLWTGKVATPVGEVARHGITGEALRRSTLVERQARSTPLMTATTTDAAPPTAARASTPAEVRTPSTPALNARVTHAAAQQTPAPTTTEPQGAAEDTTGKAPKANSLLEETELLRKAQTALRAGDAAGALTKLDELGARYPEGLLREERLAARVLSLCAAGRVGDARHEADSFLAQHPGSIQAKRVRGSCAFGTTGER